MSCLDIHYSVSFRAKKAVKDEKKDQTAPLVLNDIAESSSDSESEQDGESNSIAQTVCACISSYVP